MPNIPKGGIILEEQTVYCIIRKDKLADRPGKKAFRE